MPIISDEYRRATSLQRDHSISSSLWTKQEQQALLMTISVGAGMIAATAMMRYGYPYIYRYSQKRSKQNEGTPLPIHDSKQQLQGGDLDVVTGDYSYGTGIAAAPFQSKSKFKARWPWDRLKRKQHSSLPLIEAFGPNIPTVMPSDANNLHMSTNEDQRGKDQRCCIGSIFGLDVGGTLAKLCYFESSSSVALLNGENEVASNSESATTRFDRSSRPQKHGRKRSRSMSGRIRYTDHRTAAAARVRASSSGRHVLVRRSWVSHSPDGGCDGGFPRSQGIISTAKEVGDRVNHDNSDDVDPDNSISPNLRRVRSMISFSSSPFLMNDSDPIRDDHAEALSRFYNFARRLDTYRAGVRDHKLSFYCKELDGSFHFIQFETRRMKYAMDLIRAHGLHHNIHKMGGTGGGAHKFAALWQQELGITMKKQDELDSLVAGMQFVLRTVVGECYTFRPTKESGDQAKKLTKEMSASSGLNNHYGNYFGVDEVESDGDDLILIEKSEEGTPAVVTDTSTQMKGDIKECPSYLSDKDSSQGDEWWWSRKVQRDSISSDSSTYPYLVVTIGTGVSVLRVDGPRKYERVSGSTIGGGTYLGLIRLLTDVEDFDEVMHLAERGDPSKVDMMVGDIYGENSDALEKLGLESNLVASSFGKLVAKDDPAAGLKQEDLARALLLMITNNIGQVAYLNAKLFQTPRIYFVGNFLRHNHISERRLSFAINYWSKGEMEALFLEHEGYFGALGAFLLAQEITLLDKEKARYSPASSAHSSFNVNNDESSSLRPDVLHRRSTTISHFDVPR